MNGYTQLGLAIAIIAAMFVGGIWFMKRNERIPVYGIDTARGSIERRKLKKNTHGGVTWRDGADHGIHLVLEDAFSYRGRGGPEYIANIREGRGTVIRIADDGSSYGLDGKRLWYALFGGGLKDIAESSKNDINKTLTIIMIGGGVLLLAVLGAALYAIKLLQDANTVAL